MTLVFVLSWRLTWIAESIAITSVTMKNMPYDAYKFHRRRGSFGVDIAINSASVARMVVTEWTAYISIGSRRLSLLRSTS